MLRIIDCWKYKYRSMCGSVLAILALGSFLTVMVIDQPIDLQAKEQESRPNILLILADDIGFSDIAPFGSEIATPNIDNLAEDGQILTNFHVLPACSPTRSEILTGVDNHLNGLGTMFETITPDQMGKPGYETFLNDRVITIADRLKDTGYHTMLSGKWHLSWQGEQVTEKYISEPSTEGFDYSYTLLGAAANHFNGSGTCSQCLPPTFLQNGVVIQRPEGLYSSNLYTEKMINFMKQTIDDPQPMFMYLAFQAAHVPMEAPERLIDKYTGKYASGWEPIREKRFENGKRIGIWSAEMNLPERFPPDPELNRTSTEYQKYWSRTMATHAAMVENIDYNIGRIINYLKKTGQYDNTLIMFTSDNGGSNPSLRINTVEVSPLSGGKGSMYEGGIRSPLIIKEPTSAGSTEKGYISSPDNVIIPKNQSGNEIADVSSYNSSVRYEIVKSFANALDIVPTLLDYAGAHGDKHQTLPPILPSVLGLYTGSALDNKNIYDPTGKSLRPVLEGSSLDTHGDLPFSQELFGNSVVFMNDWKAVRHIPPVGDGLWELYNLTADPAETDDLAANYPQRVEKMGSAYNDYSTSVNVIPPDMKYFPMEIFGTLPKIYGGTHNGGRSLSADIAR